MTVRGTDRARERGEEKKDEKDRSLLFSSSARLVSLRKRERERESGWELGIREEGGNKMKRERGAETGLIVTFFAV